jgi:hypothetical protein
LYAGCTFILLILCALETAIAVTPSFINGKVEVIDTNLTGPESIFDLELNSTVTSDHVVCTGVGSRTELHDRGLIIRLGANTVVQKKTDFTYWLHSGSVLICAKDPTEFRINSIRSSAGFKGRGTIIVESTANGGFKLIPLEVKGNFTTENGGEKEAKSGQLLFVIEKPSNFGDAYDIDLMLLLRSSHLVNSYPDPLPTFGRVGLAIYSQELKLKGKYDALIGDAPTTDKVQLWTFHKEEGFSRKKKQSKDKHPTQSKGFWKRLFEGNNKE